MPLFPKLTSLSHGGHLPRRQSYLPGPPTPSPDMILRPCFPRLESWRRKMGWGWPLNGEEMAEPSHSGIRITTCNEPTTTSLQQISPKPHYWFEG
ncbi:hypothetical protein BJY04DRAFT_198611 [Aspergillus karnatakaensis]|uniref:uncharacterized protein n=1 Tax=Aspergillus karnatakaensis TaxID=1810916 RepID=UPI003CCD2D87